jgi:uncharacterized caspase-like protein
LQGESNKIHVRVENRHPKPLQATVRIGCQDDPNGVSLHVLAVGVSKYNDSRVPALECADKDALDLVEALKGARKLFPNIVLTREKLPDGPPLKGVLLNEEAKKEAIIQELRGLFKRVREHDLAILFFSGHGMSHEASGSYYFLPYDYQANGGSTGTALSWEAMKDYLAYMPCRVIVILDTCHSGAAGLVRARGNVKKDLEEAIEKAMREFAKSRRGIAILSACLAHQRALEHKQAWGHGVLTLSLLECLRGERIPNDGRKGTDAPLLPSEERSTGVITLADLHRYAEKRVWELVGNDQAVVLRTFEDMAAQQIPLAVIDRGKGPTAPGEMRPVPKR